MVYITTFIYNVHLQRPFTTFIYNVSAIVLTPAPLSILLEAERFIEMFVVKLLIVFTN